MAAAAVEVGGLLGRDAVRQHKADDLLLVIIGFCPVALAPQERLELVKARFDWVVLGAIRRQKAQQCASRRDQWKQVRLQVGLVLWAVVEYLAMRNHPCYYRD